VSKLAVFPVVFGFTFVVISGAIAQGVSYTANPSNPTADQTAGGLSMPGAGASATGKNSTGDNGTEQPDDPTLMRLKGKDSLAAGSMSRDEGQLTAKARRREKISQVESTKQLHTSGIDPKFQGSLLHSSVGSIRDIGEKAATTNTSADTDTEVKDEGDPRFKAKSLMLTPATEEESKKSDSPRIKADASPSPSPSPTASVTPSNR
jgi:hypothetical protein